MTSRESLRTLFLSVVARSESKLKFSFKFLRLLTIEDGVFEVLATAGDTHLGGEDIDNRVIDHFVSLWKRKNGGKDVSTNLRTMGKLKREVEAAKRTLSSQQSAKIEVESFFEGKDLSETLTRAKFEELNMDIFQRTLRPVEKVLKDAKFTKVQVNDIVYAPFLPFSPFALLLTSASDSWEARRASPRSKSCSKNSLTARSLRRESTPMKRWRTAPLFKPGSSSTSRSLFRSSSSTSLR